MPAHAVNAMRVLCYTNCLLVWQFHQNALRKKRCFVHLTRMP